MNINQIVNEFISKKNAYKELNISNIWAAHLLAIAIRNPSLNTVISEALKGEAVVQKPRKPTVFLDVSPKSEGKVEGCEGCDKKKTAVLAALATTKKAAEAETSQSVMQLYSSKEELIRAALQLGISVHHKAKEETIAQQIAEKLNK